MEELLKELKNADRRLIKIKKYDNKAGLVLLVK